MSSRITGRHNRNRRRRRLGSFPQLLATIIVGARLIPKLPAALGQTFGRRTPSAKSGKNMSVDGASASAPSEQKFFTRRRLKYTPLIILIVAFLEGSPLFAARGLDDPFAGYAAVALGGAAGGIGWLLADHINTLKIRRGFPLGVVALTWGLLGGLTVGFKFYASEVGRSFLPSTIIIAAVMGLVSGMTVSVTQDRKMPLGRWVKTAIVFGGAISIVRFLDTLMVVAVFSKWPPSQKLWVAVKIGAESFILVAPLSVATLWIGSLLGHVLKPILTVYDEWWAALKELGAAVVGFFLAYVLTVIAFAAQFWAVWNIDHCRFYSCRTQEEAS